MPQVLTSPDQLKQLFTALTEQTFQVELGVADPPLTDYLSGLLVRFIKIDAIFKLRDIMGRRLEEVADMLMAAEECQEQPKREFHRHIGDFTLFWTGVYPEALKHLKGLDRKDSMIDYCEQGKRSYFLASKLPPADSSPDSSVLLRLSREFELCSVGLNRVRKEWEQMGGRCGGNQ